MTAATIRIKADETDSCSNIYLYRSADGFIEDLKPLIDQVLLNLRHETTANGPLYTTTANRILVETAVAHNAKDNHWDFYCDFESGCQGDINIEIDSETLAVTYNDMTEAEYIADYNA